MILAVRGNAPYETVDDLIAAIKEQQWRNDLAGFRCYCD